MNEGSLIGRVAYALGLTVRWTVDLFSAPYRILSPTASASPQKQLPDSHRPRQRLSGRPRMERLPSVSTAAKVAARDGMVRLSAALTNPDPTARMLALEAIGELDAEHAAQMIIDTLHDPDPDVRCAAAEAAVQARASAAVFSLILALDDEELEVREEAHLAIERITGQEIGFEPAGDPAARQRRIDQLKRWWKEMRFAQLASDHKVGAG